MMKILEDPTTSDQVKDLWINIMRQLEEVQVWGYDIMKSGPKTGAKVEAGIDQEELLKRVRYLEDKLEAAGIPLDQTPLYSNSYVRNAKPELPPPQSKVSCCTARPCADTGKTRHRPLVNMVPLNEQVVHWFPVAVGHLSHESDTGHTTLLYLWMP